MSGRLNNVKLPDHVYLQASPLHRCPGKGIIYTPDHTQGGTTHAYAYQ